MKQIDMHDIYKDMLLLINSHSDVVKHLALFGSVLKKPLSEVGDVDVLILYSNSDFLNLKSVILNSEMSLNTYESYLNTGYIKAERAINTPPGYHFILMPIKSPCYAFLQRNKGNMLFLTEDYFDFGINDNINFISPNFNINSQYNHFK